MSTQSEKEEESPSLAKLTLTDNNVSRPNNDGQDEQSCLSPTTQEAMGILLANVRTGKAQLNYDDKGNVVVDYPLDKRKVVLDASAANKLAIPKTDDDMKDKVEETLELVKYLKTEVPSSGVVLDTSKVSPSGKLYREGKEFEMTKKVLGSGRCANDIVVVKDKRTQEEHALKTMMISCFNPNEIRCWVDMSHTGLVPGLYIFNIQDNKMYMHMEKLDKAKTLRNVIDEEMGKFYTRDEDQKLVKPFSLFVLDGALEAVTAMHDKNWLHNDLHGGNVMVQKQPGTELKIKVLDFGSVGQLESPNCGINFRSFKADIANVLRLFTGLYTFQEFDNVFDIRQNWQTKLAEVTGHLSREDREELFCLVDAAFQILTPAEVHQYRELVKEKLESAMGDLESQMDIMKRASLILFPEDFGAIHPDMTAQECEGVVVYSESQSNEADLSKVQESHTKFTDEVEVLSTQRSLQRILGDEGLPKAQGSLQKVNNDDTIVKPRPAPMDCDDEADYLDVADAPGCHGDADFSPQPVKFHSLDDIFKMARHIPDYRIDKLRLGISIKNKKA